ncbi:MAG: hypothetical protein SAL07_22005 [Oscillatoria sp. PMC 1051.18]|uniref:hypothetical protein n=1 Tax=Oscillatoria salina TaxID=331517 RepID=UPI0013BB6A14|nr:hypothetical protein [Oscillatoria salina]MBZ8182007.1 hypothetical protein [Oscillatoria salina IIICB1]MEC4894882.1 hypothetical protein [Oscillatoria sp. PMC 1050.18]MEC5032584.1 hypothetical protein [Oscillatoria sp. PMC 1051.18]NET89390.1 hypothetical protein [Kamptonema sp. SIO1D9]
MEKIKRLSWVLGLSMVAVSLTVSPAKADGSYSDITGTNIWNNTAPIFEGSEGGIDPDLVARVERLNEESAAAFQACNAAIAQVEQQLPPSGPRRFARQPQPGQSPGVPVACQRLNELRVEVENVRLELQELAGTVQSGYATW